MYATYLIRVSFKHIIYLQDIILHGGKGLKYQNELLGRVHIREDILLSKHFWTIFCYFLTWKARNAIFLYECVQFGENTFFLNTCFQISAFHNYAAKVVCFFQKNLVSHGVFIFHSCMIKWRIYFISVWGRVSARTSWEVSYMIIKVSQIWK